MKETTLERFFLSPAFCSHNGVVPLSQEGASVRLGVLREEPPELRSRIARAWPDRSFSFAVLPAEEFSLAISRLYASEGEEEGDAAPGSGDVSAIDSVELGAPVVNLLNSILLEALSLKASDVHIESERDCAAVRFRVDGRLRPSEPITSERALALSSRLKHLANLNIIESRRPQDGRITLTALGRTVDLRLSAVPTVRGESVVLRLLKGDDETLSLDSLGFAPRELERIRRGIGSRSGLVLVTGPTGSGKTTTLSAMLRELKGGDTKIVSIEDPVEYRLEGITQIQTDDALGLSFESLLRRVFRQDPDVIMIGEIRDGETARLAARAALTGHLVFATVHASGALETLPRLFNLGVEPYVTASVLNLAVAQRLLRKLCPACGGAGCPSCGTTGYSGRTVVSETVAGDADFRRAVEGGYARADAEAAALRGGFRSLREDALDKAAAGITDLREILREIGP